MRFVLNQKSVCFSKTAAHSVAVILFVVGSLLTTPVAARAQVNQYAYIGDYDGQAVHRFNAITGALDNAAYITFTAGVEGMGGTGNNLFVATGSGIYKYDISGNTPVQVGSQFGVGSFQMAISNDGKYLYAAQSDKLARYDLTASNIGASVITVSTPNSWGVAIGQDGSVYVNNGWSNGSVGIQKFSADLSTETDFLTAAQATSDGFKAGAGLAFDNSGNLWAVNGGNQDPNNGFITEFDTTTGNLIQTVQFPNVNNPGPGNTYFNRPFGAAVGPNGDIFVSSQGSGGCVLEVHNSNYGGTTGYALNDVSTFVTVTSNSSVSSSLQSAKTIFFSSQFVNSSPEPSEFIFGGIFGLGLFGMILRARRRNA